MKTQIAFILALTSFTSAWASTEVVNVPVEAIYIPTQGFDDNDQVLAVVRGTFENSCYSLSGTVAEASDDNTTITLTQKAIRQTDGLCATPEKLPAQMRVPAPFTAEVNLGRLNSQGYTLLSKNPQGGTISRAFEVSKSANPTIDNTSYALVTGAQTLESIGSNQEIQLTLTGLITQSCATLKDQPRIQTVDDVIVVMPTLDVKLSMNCKSTQTPFMRTLSLGKRAPGQYLIHIRSINGRAFNQIVNVR